VLLNRNDSQLWIRRIDQRQLSFRFSPRLDQRHALKGMCRLNELLIGNILYANH